MARRPRAQCLLILLACAAWSPAAFAEQATWTYTNGPTATTNELLRLDVRLKSPFDATRLLVTEDGREVAYQVEVLEGAPAAVHKGNIWVCTDLPAGASRSYAVTTAANPRKFEPRVKLTRNGHTFVLDNGLIAVKLPAAHDKLAGPVQSLRLPDGSWAGSSRWQTTAAFNSLNPVVQGDGTIFARVLLRYIFNDPTYGGPRVPFSYITITLKPGQRALEIDESFEITDGTAWLLDFGKDFRPSRDAKPREPLTLLSPKHHVTATPVRAEKWVRPDENHIRVRPDALASVKLPSNEGSRSWLLSTDVARATSP